MMNLKPKKLPTLLLVTSLPLVRAFFEKAIDKMAMVFDKLLNMSTFSSVARLWWVAAAYTDYVKHNDIANKLVHSRIFRKIDDRFRDLEQSGESALVRDPGDELIKIMLFYTGVGEKRSERMDEIVSHFLWD